MAKKPPLGSGARFSQLAATLGQKPGVNDPKALAASIGRKKYGKKRFARLGQKGKGLSEAAERKAGTPT